MNRHRFEVSAIVLCVATLLLAANTLAQAPFLPASVKVSNAVEGGAGGVSAARCGAAVVVAFGDVEPHKSNSYDGFSYSRNNGASFTDDGTLSLASPADFVGTGAGFYPSNLVTSPAVACSSAAKFYYASAGSVGNPSCGGTCSILNASIGVATSSDGGVHWTMPIEVAHQLSDTETFLSPSIAVDPSNPSRVWVAYLHYSQNPSGDASFIFCNSPGYFIELAGSADGGKTWFGGGFPSVIDYSCGAGATAEHTGALGAPSVAVSPAGAVYIAYEFMKQEAFTGQSIRNEIRFSHSTNHGKTFSAPITVSTDAIAMSLVQMAVDRTNSRYRGAIYLAWSGKPSGSFTDVLVSDSLNSGASFSFPRAISSNPTSGAGRYQTNPVLAVDKDGAVAACFYETSHNQPISSSIYSYRCAASSNHAVTWLDQTVANSVPVGYDALTVDFLLHGDGFFSAYEITSGGKRSVIAKSADPN